MKEKKMIAKCRRATAGKLLFCIALMLGACKGDEEPSTRELLIGSWELAESTNSLDYSLQITFHRNGGYTETIVDSGETENYYGAWVMLSDGETVEIDYGGSIVVKLTILYVTTKELEAEDGDGNRWRLKRAAK